MTNWHLLSYGPKPKFLTGLFAILFLLSLFVPAIANAGQDENLPDFDKQTPSTMQEEMEQKSGTGTREQKHVGKKDPGKPDLVPAAFKEKKVTYYSKKKNSCEFSVNFRIKNIGTAKAKKSHWEFSGGKKKPLKRKTGVLKPGEQTSKKTATGEVIGLGRHTLKLTVDSKNEVDEIKENNNTKTITIVCKKKPKKP